MPKGYRVIEDDLGRPVYVTENGNGSTTYEKTGGEIFNVSARGTTTYCSPEGHTLKARKGDYFQKDDSGRMEVIRAPRKSILRRALGF